ncbi:hypothetical protein [Mucilaginibacter sp.]|uniref:hypothetical protein n=1 Tax=Mucilaginibacter sp. TaxID=1882438 RepID=UPI0025F82730|nr:hypothetical protein [Mucilaginibacter sp.]
MLSLYKKAAILLLLLIFCSSATFAQRPLTLSKERSYYTYIYKLTTANVLNFYKYPDKNLDERMLQHPIDSFKTGSYWENTLPAGNYLKVYAEKNRLSYSLIENHSVFIKVLHNDYDQRFVLQDKQGNNIVNAVVCFNGKALRFDDKSSTWHVKRSKKANMVQADYAGVSNFFIVKEQGFDRDDDDQNWFATLWASIKKIFKKENGYQYSHYRYKQKPKPYIGFVVFNKPLYKPNDTVKFKAFILNAKTKLPVTQKKLLVKLHDGRQSEGKTIGTVSSYRDGGFEYSFALSDTLTLDESYSIALVDPDAKKIAAGKVDNYNIYNDPSVLIFSSFKYEEYELKSTKFECVPIKKSTGGVSRLQFTLRLLMKMTCRYPMDVLHLRSPPARLTLIPANVFLCLIPYGCMM